MSSGGIIYKGVGIAAILHLVRKVVRFDGRDTGDLPSQRFSILLFSRLQFQNNSDYPFLVPQSIIHAIS
jgi:hypothetical protein